MPKLYWPGLKVPFTGRWARLTGLGNHEKCTDILCVLDRDGLLAIMNGAIREALYGQFMQELAAHQLSTLVGLILFGVHIWALSGIFRIQSSKQAIIIGGLWLIMTIAFAPASKRIPRGLPRG